MSYKVFSSALDSKGCVSTRFEQVTRGFTLPAITLSKAPGLITRPLSHLSISNISGHKVATFSANQPYTFCAVNPRTAVTVNGQIIKTAQNPWANQVLTVACWPQTWFIPVVFRNHELGRHLDRDIHMPCTCSLRCHVHHCRSVLQYQQQTALWQLTTIRIDKLTYLAAHVRLYRYMYSQATPSWAGWHHNNALALPRLGRV